VYSEECGSKKQAIRRERELKGWKSSKRLIEELTIDMDIPGSSGPVVTG
jgi:predicted GIY-YIG superfamily endonuclease